MPTHVKTRTPDPSPRPQTKIAAVLEDQRRRWQTGDRVPLETYFTADPSLAANEGVLLDLVYGEFLLAEEFGQPDPEADLARRFPEVAAELAVQVGLHQALIDAAQTATLVPAMGGADVAPTILGYDIERELGRGGMGVVYRARQRGLNRVVALKTILHPEPTESGGVVRFLAEAEAVAAIRHPHVVQIFDFAEHDGTPYFTMELLTGGSLRDRLAGGPLTPDVAANLIASVARGVQAAHDQQVVHRDLKPANILFDDNDRPIVTDFGLARRGAGTGLTQTNVVLGTPAYMSPEQATGKGKFLGPAADVYALGVVFYECLTGKVPFTGDSALSVLRRVAHEDPESPRQRNPNIPRDLELVCLKCLEKAPADRYATASDLAADLERFGRGEPVAVRAPGPIERATRWARRHPHEAGLGGALVLVLVAAAIGGAWAAVSMRHQRDVARSNESRAVSAEDDLRAELIRSNRSVAGEVRAMRLRGQPGRYFTGMAKLREALATARRLEAPAEDLAAIRDEMMNLCAVTDVAVDAEWDGRPDGAIATYFSPTLDRYILTAVGLPPTLHESPGGRLIATFPSQTPSAPFVHFSPDGRLVLLSYTGIRRVSAWRLDGELRAPEWEAAGASSGVFVAGGRSVAVGSPGAPPIRILDARDGTERHKWPDAHLPSGPAAHPTRPWLAVERDGRLEVVNTETRATVAQVKPPVTEPAVAWHPTRPVLAFSGASPVRLRLWDVESDREAAPPLDGHVHGGVFPGCDPTGELVVSSDWAGGLRCWDAQTGRPRLSLPVGWLTPTFTFSPQGDRLAAGADGGRVQVFRVHPGRGLRVMALADPEVNGINEVVAASPDGRLLAARTLADRCVLLDPIGGVELATVPDAWRAIRFLTDGSLLTAGPGGALRWPVVHDGNRCTVGPPTRLLSWKARVDWAATADGKMLVAPLGSNVFFWNADQKRIQAIPDQADARKADVSPDQMWLATGSHVAGAVSVYRGTDGVFVHQLASTGGRPVFSPDSARLAVVAFVGGVRVFEVGTWRELWQASGYRVAFAPDGSILAFGEGYGVIRLRAAADGRDIARLEVPDQTRLAPETFGADGGRLLAVGMDNQLLYAWDLRHLRARLAEEGLDWDWPAFGPAIEAVAPSRVEVIPNAGK